MEALFSKPRKRLFKRKLDYSVDLLFSRDQHRAIRKVDFSKFILIERPPREEQWIDRVPLPSKWVKDGEGELHEVEQWKDVPRTREIDRNIRFPDLYGRRTYWECDNEHEYLEFKKELDEGLKRFYPVLSASLNPIDAKTQTYDPLDIYDLLRRAPRFQGCHIIGYQGSGKTNLLQCNFAFDIEDANNCVIVMDAKGDLIQSVRNLKSIQDRLVYFDCDPDYPIRLNPIEAPDPSLPPGQRKLAVNRSVLLLEYLLNAIETNMTPLQSRVFKAVAKAVLLCVPNPTLATIRDVIANGHQKYDFSALDPEDLEFFSKTEFYDQKTKERRMELLPRIALIRDHPVTRPMFDCAKSEFDLYELMNQRKVIIINNSVAALDQSTEFFSRLWITLIRRAAYRRSSLEDHEKVPTYFYIDECHRAIRRDPEIPTIIDECRSQRVGLILAHQRRDQIEAHVLSALDNCAIKMYSTEETKLPVGAFATTVRGLTDGVITVQVPRAELGETITSAIVAKPQAPDPVPEPPPQPKRPPQPAPDIDTRPSPEL